MKFDPKIIMLIRGLVEGASSVVHLNGGFTQEIELQRGVRQGCPLAPLLFSLSTQPLMALLRKAQVDGCVQGLEAGDGRQILEALFADDTGLLLQANETNWTRTTAVVKQFEKISGAKLNVAKSLVIPIGFTEPPPWLIATGCKLALSGEVYTYLGCPIGVSLTEEQTLQFLLDKLTKRLNHLQFLLDKLTKRLNHWTHKFLTWEGRLILTRHVFLAMPNYVMMVMGLTDDGYKELTRICQGFVWGTSKEGNEKKALVAWDTFCRRKEEGGVGLTAFDTQAKALKMRFVSQLLEDKDSDWVHLAKAIIQWKTANTASRSEENQWQPRDILLLGARLKLSETPTLNRMLEGWWTSKRWLNFKGVINDLPGHTPIEQILRIGASWEGLNKKDLHQARSLLKREGVHYLSDWNDTLSVRLQANDRSRGLKGGEARLVPCREVCGSFFFSPPAVYHEGFFTEDRARKMNLSTGTCSRCGDDIETVQHCFLTCRIVRRRWEELIQTLNEVQPEILPIQTGPEWLETTTRHKPTALTCQILTVAHLRSVWRERCEAHFRESKGICPSLVILNESLASAQAIYYKQQSVESKKQVDESKAYLELMISVRRRRGESHKLMELA
ncbi:hypothetical protein R1sor_004823 [Riccia sorocarpa]|uniref:Reverse transcriptase domain-containing protein n=1 Tax=Riccia sorocarpa TaxID=122646 RepID=A0ABD3HI26_9MARC